MPDTSIKKVQARFSPHGDMGQKYLVSSKRVSMRLWALEPGGEVRMQLRNLQIVEPPAEVHGRDAPEWRLRARHVGRNNQDRVIMPLRDYEAFFNPDEVGRMISAFDSAWQKLAASLGAAKNAKEIQTLRASLAECIVISALDTSDEGPENLADEALRCLHETHLMNHGVSLTFGKD